MSLKQSSLDPASSRLPVGQAFDCWHRDRNRGCLRVEVGADDAFIFPYQQFLGAHHTRAAKLETLQISFSTHIVVLSGSDLGEIAAALQDLSVDWVKSLPQRYQSLTANEGARVTQIEIKPVE